MSRIISVLPLVSSLLLTTACGGGGGGSSAAGATPSVEAPPPPLQESYTLSSEDSVPANFTFDPVDRAFYAAGRNGGSIVRVAADGAESIFLAGNERVSSIGGVKVDAEARRLWACADNVDGIDNRVWVFDLQSGELVQEYLLAALYTDGACHDLVLDKNGVAYVVDGSNPTIYRLDPVTELGELYLSDPLLEGSGAPLGPNGIEIVGEGRALVVGTFATGQLTYISLPQPERVSPLELRGDDFSLPNGMAVFEGDLYVTSIGALSRVRFNDDFSGGTVVRLPQNGGISSATVAEGSLYVIKGETYAFAVGQPLDLPFLIYQVDVAAYE